MEEARLSERERRILAEIEEQLDQDETLAHRLRTMRRGPRLPLRQPSAARRRMTALGVAALGALSLTLLVLAVATEAPPLIWAFAATWVLTLVTLLRLVVRWSKRVAASRKAPDG
ncbi:DUF3040 domain-containing protein [Streptomyces sp. NPDC051742]|uniref:DUF3040 domain-containing protein n=1 Tax=unclassified Streptomyces TaxID=2593676 RepID=UPI0034458E29